MPISDDVQRHSVHTLVFRSLKRTHDLFLCDQGSLAPINESLETFKKTVKLHDQYGPVLEAVSKNKLRSSMDSSYAAPKEEELKQIEDIGIAPTAFSGVAPQSKSMALVPVAPVSGISTQALVPKKAPIMPKPKWHPPWKLARVISGHLGWVRCVAVEPGNEWFATGSNDRIIKIWDLASGLLKLSLTGHVSTVRGLAVSPRHPYLFSCGEDKQVKCWDLEYNKVIRHYHGHLSACHALALHPTIDVLVTCGRDSTTRVWDMRTKANIHTLVGHSSTVASVVAQATDPQNMAGHNAIINALAVSREGVMVSGADNGTLYFWDWRTGYNFQKLQAPVQPGSMDSESGIFAMAFDHSGSRLITCDADKTIKIYKEDDTATEETHPVNWRPDILKRRKY